MVIIRDLDESGRVVESLNIKNWFEMYLHYTRNDKRTNVSIDYSLLKVGVFGSYDNTGSSRSDNEYLFSCSLLENFQQMDVATYIKYTSIEDFGTPYTNKERFLTFRRQIGISSTSHEEDIILKVCAEKEKG